MSRNHVYRSSSPINGNYHRNRCPASILKWRKFVQYCRSLWLWPPQRSPGESMVTIHLLYSVFVMRIEFCSRPSFARFSHRHVNFRTGLFLRHLSFSFFLFFLAHDDRMIPNPRTSGRSCWLRRQNTCMPSFILGGDNHRLGSSAATLLWVKIGNYYIIVPYRTQLHYKIASPTIKSSFTGCFWFWFCCC